MKRRIRKPFIMMVTMVLMFLLFVFVGCGSNQNVTITFETNGGNEIAPVTLKKGEELNLPLAVKDGRVFLDWYFDAKFENICPKTIIAEKDKTLYARYSVGLAFDASGGTEVDSRTYYEGEKIGELPITYKDGFSFSGWYYDPSYEKIVSKNDIIETTITIYAKFAETSDTLRKLTSVKNSSVSPTIKVKTNGTVLHNDNVSDYISFISSNGEKIEVICRPLGNDIFAIEPSKKLSEGATYSVRATSSTTKFINVDDNDTESADEVTITTRREKKEVINKRDTVHIVSSELAKWDEKVYVYMDLGLEKDVNRIFLRTKENIEIGSIVTIGDSALEKEDDYICKVIAVKKEKMQYTVGTELKIDEFTIIDVITPNVDDVYLDLDIYDEKQAMLEGYITLSPETVAENVENNEGIVMLKTAVREAIAQSPTVLEYANKLSTEEERKALALAIAKFDFNKPKVKIDITGSVLAFEIELGGQIQVKNFKVGVNVVIKNKTTVDYRYTICKSGLITLNPLLWFYTDIKVDLTNDFSISLSASVEFADGKEDIKGIIDITDEVEYIVDIGKDGQNKFAEAITGSPLWDGDSELEYVDIFSIPLGQIPLPVPVVSLQIDFNVVGSLGARAGLYVEFSHHYVESTTLTNGLSACGANGKPEMFNEFRFSRATLANEIELAITLKGQVGFRCGLEVKLSLSVLRLNNVAAVYVSFRFGPYIELSGLVNFRYFYDAVNKSAETHLYGGMYLEVGLFVNAKLGAKFLVYDLNTDIFDKKISLYGVGDRLIPLRFQEKTNTTDDPFVITSRHGGVRLSTVQMIYLDIVTGEEVVDNASRNQYGTILNYEFEFYDAPDYQTDNYKDFVTISGRATLISKKYPFKSLKFAVKAKLVPGYGVYANAIERIFYVEYRNPDGRDYATQNSEFRNEYYAGGGSTYSEVLAFLTFKEGEQVTPPELTMKNLPVRPGYYLDLNDLWEKYYPFLEDKVDENFDGTFPKVTYENATEIFKGYMVVNTCYYRLKWKQCTYTADFYYPEYESADVISKNNHLATINMIYVPILRAFIGLTDKINAPDISGKKFDMFVCSNGLQFKNNYYNVDPNADAFKGISIKAGYYPIFYVDVDSDLYVNNFVGIKDGAEFVASYTDSNIFTETYVLETETVKRIKQEYKPFDYEGKAIRPIPPVDFSIGTEFVENGNTYVITGYRDINPESEERSRYFDITSMPDVTKDRIYYVLYERKGLSELPVYYINIYANGKSIGSYGIKQGELINLDLLKINFDDKTVISKLAGYPISMIDSVVKSYSVSWDNIALPTHMPENDITIELSASYSLEELTAEFIVKNPLQSFVDGTHYEIRPNGDKVYVASGKTWTFGSSDEATFYSLPKLNDYFDNENKKYYAFYGWKNKNGEELPYGVSLAFIADEAYEPIFVEKTILPTIAFISIGEYGYEYYYRIIEGDYFGKTLKEIIEKEKIMNPTRGDINGIYEYTFQNWGVDIDSYVIGSEKDLNGNVKTYLVFKAQFLEKDKPHTIIFDAMGSTFANGEKTIKKVGAYGDDISGIVPKNYTDEKGEFIFVCWTTVPYSLEDRVDESELKIGNSDATYYAYYLLNPATITLTFKGKVETEETDGTGNVYFGGDKNKTELVVEGLYGQSYYITGSDFAVDSLSKTFVPDYLKWTVGGIEYISSFYNDGYLANIPFDNNAVVEIVFKKATPKVVNIAFVSDGECFELNGEKIEGVICNGFMSGLRHVANYYENYGTKMLAPFIDYYSDNYYRFDHWESKPENGKQSISVKPGEEITFTEDMVFYGVYVHDTTEKVKLTFRSEMYRNINEGSNVYGIMTFPDGSVEITDFGTYGEKISFNKIPSCKGMIFVGWTTDGNNIITQEELASMSYTTKTEYYAVYLPDPTTFKVTINAKDGKFANGKTEKTIYDITYGMLTDELEKAKPNVDDLVFSHYEDENGYPVTVIEKEMTLYARYAKPIYTIKQLQDINLAPEENYVLMNNIIHGRSIFEDDSSVNWISLGSGAKNGFSGTFNGNGYKVQISMKSGTKENFGLFSKISGTIYNLCFVGYSSITGSTDATSLGVFCSEVTESGRIIDSLNFTRFNVQVSALQRLSVSGSIGTNNGLVDGFMACTSGTISIDSSKEFVVGAAVATNTGTMRNVDQSGMGGSIYVYLARSLNCYIGSFAGYNSGTIEDSFSERPITINLSQGDNIYIKDSVIIGGFVGKNDGIIKNATTLYGKLEYSVKNITLFNEKGLEVYYNPHDENPSYVIYVLGEDNQGITYTTKCVIYLDEDAKKTGSTEYEEYTISEFRKKYSEETKKLDTIRESVSFGSFISSGNGKSENCTVIEDIGTGNIVELVSSCNFDGAKWNYLARLHDLVYKYND